MPEPQAASSTSQTETEELRFAELAVKNGHCSPAQVADAFATKKKLIDIGMGETLPNILIKKKALTEKQVANLQKALKPKSMIAGFEIIENRYFFVSILPLLWLRKFLHPDNGSKAEWEQGKEISLNPVLNRFLLWLCRIENKMSCLLPNSFGGSLMVVARKEQD